MENVAEKDLAVIASLTDEDRVRVVTSTGESRSVKKSDLYNVATPTNAGLLPAGVLNFFTAPSIMTDARKIATIKPQPIYATETMRISCAGFGAAAEVILNVTCSYQTHRISCDVLYSKITTTSAGIKLIVDENGDVYITGSYWSVYTPSTGYTLGGGGLIIPVVDNTRYETSKIVAEQTFNLHA